MTNKKRADLLKGVACFLIGGILVIDGLVALKQNRRFEAILSEMEQDAEVRKRINAMHIEVLRQELNK